MVRLVQEDLEITVCVVEIGFELLQDGGLPEPVEALQSGQVQNLISISDVVEQIADSRRVYFYRSQILLNPDLPALAHLLHP